MWPKGVGKSEMDIHILVLFKPIQIQLIQNRDTQNCFRRFWENPRLYPFRPNEHPPPHYKYHWKDVDLSFPNILQKLSFFYQQPSDFCFYIFGQKSMIWDLFKCWLKFRVIMFKGWNALGLLHHCPVHLMTRANFSKDPTYSNFHAALQTRWWRRQSITTFSRWVSKHLLRLHKTSLFAMFVMCGQTPWKLTLIQTNIMLSF